MNYMGDFLEDATVYITFNTFDSNDPSASVTITDLAAGDVEIWKDGVVQTTPGSGVTLTLNIGTNNGTHLIAVDTSNTTDGGFYVISADYQVRINGTTIDGATVNAWVGSFSIENRFKDVNVVSEADIDFGAAKKTSLNAATTDLSAITGDKASYKATGFSTHNAAAVKTAMEAEGASDLDLIADAVTNGTYGLSALETLVDEIETLLKDATYGLSALRTRGDSDWITATGFSTHDAAAVKTAIEIAGSSLAQILTDTGTTLENRQVTIATDAARLTAVRAAVLTDWINDGRLDVILDAIKVVTDNLASSATTIVSGTVAATAGSTTTIYSDDITEATPDHYNGRIIIFTSGDMQNQATDITDYVLEGGEGKFTVTATTETAAEDVTFVIV